MIASRSSLENGSISSSCLLEDFMTLIFSAMPLKGFMAIKPDSTAQSQQAETWVMVRLLVSSVSVLRKWSRILKASSRHWVGSLLKWLATAAY